MAIECGRLETISPAPMPETNALLLTEREAAERLRIGRTTLWRLRRDGKLPSVNIGRAVRYRVEDVQRLAQNGDAEVAK